MSDIVLARCDCDRGHWLARLKVRDGVAGVEWRSSVVGVTASGDATSDVALTVAWTPYEDLREFVVLTVPARCPGNRSYRLDLVQLAGNYTSGGPTIISKAERSDTVDIADLRASSDLESS